MSACIQVDQQWIRPPTVLSLSTKAVQQRKMFKLNRINLYSRDLLQ